MNSSTQSEIIVGERELYGNRSVPLNHSNFDKLVKEYESVSELLKDTSFFRFTLLNTTIRDTSGRVLNCCPEYIGHYSNYVHTNITYFYRLLKNIASATKRKSDDNIAEILEAVIKDVANNNNFWSKNPTDLNLNKYKNVIFVKKSENWDKPLSNTDITELTISLESLLKAEISGLNIFTDVGKVKKINQRGMPIYSFPDRESALLAMMVLKTNQKEFNEIHFDLMDLEDTNNVINDIMYTRSLKTTPKEIFKLAKELEVYYNS